MLVYRVTYPTTREAASSLAGALYRLGCRATGVGLLKIPENKASEACGLVNAHGGTYRVIG